jgi:hypothetical protein
VVSVRRGGGRNSGCSKCTFNEGVVSTTVPFIELSKKNQELAIKAVDVDCRF